MTPEEARAKYEELYGTVNDEEWSEIVADVEDWEAFFAARAEAQAEGESEEEATEAAEGAENDEAGAAEGDQVASLTARLGAVEGSVGEILGILKQQQMSEQERTVADRRAKAVGEITATQVEVKGMKHRLAASAVEVLATAMAEPTEDNVAAILEHVTRNGGRFSLIPVEFTAAVDPEKRREDPDEDVLATWAGDPDATKDIRAIMERDGVDARTADRCYRQRGAGVK